MQLRALAVLGLPRVDEINGSQWRIRIGQLREQRAIGENERSAGVE